MVRDGESEFFASGDFASYHHQVPSPFVVPSSSPHRYRVGLPMSTRQNKKQRKGRNNANNRERTVTTLTEDPNTPYLVPTPSEEPAGTHMPASFPGTNGGKLHNVTMGPQAYQMPSSFGFGYGPYPPPMTMHQQPQQNQAFFSPQQPPAHQQPEQNTQFQSPNQQTKPQLPPGKNDLEILQNLKKLIIENQHPFFRAVPQPATLASLYKGPLTSQSQPQRRTEQASTEFRNDSGDSGPENGRRQQRNGQGKDRRNTGPTNGGGNQNSSHAQGHRTNNSGGSNLLSNLNLASLKTGKIAPGPLTASPQSDPRSADSQSHSRGYNVSNDRKAAENRPRGPPVKTEPGADDANLNDRDNRAPGPADDPMDGTTTWRNGYDDSRPITWGNLPDDWATNYSRYAGRRPENEGIPASDSVDPRPSGGPDHEAGPPDAYDRDRRSWGAQNERDRYPAQDRDRDRRPTDAPQRRLSAASEQQHPYDTDQHPPPVRRPPEESSGDARRPSDPARPPLDVASRKQQPGHALVTEPVPPSPNRPPMSDARVDPRGPPRQMPTDNEDVKSSRASSVRPVDNSAVSLGSAPPASASSENATPVDSLPPSVAGQTNPPSLKDRMNPPSRQPSETTVGAHIEHHLPGPPPPTGNSYGGGSGGHQPRNKKRFNKDGGAPPRTGDRQNYRPGGGPGPGSRSYRPRSPSLDGRNKGPPSPSGARGRDYRGGGGPPPPRDLSRDRPGPGGTSYRPDYDDPRYGDGRPPFRDYSPPPPDRAGRPYSPPPSSGGRGPPTGGPEPPKDWGYGYGPRRDWAPADDDPYYNKRYYENVPPVAGDRTYEYPPPRWDSRDRDFGRDAYPPGPPDDRYPIRDAADRERPPPPGGYNNAPYNRVRRAAQALSGAALARHPSTTGARQ
ncbi:unnamed protein product [Cyclocybe aegerita]|uniref:Uncharacterized protein n=1 Tax=Cyclocybe aegerita TaxID=1973307 RepID=A0A8S0VTP5_CYCAE|nr:unnamed protein product [Cyclocybe aegerita]